MDILACQHFQMHCDLENMCWLLSDSNILIHHLHWGITRGDPLSQLHIISLHLHSYSLLRLFPHTQLWFLGQFVAAGWGGGNWTGASWNLRCVFETICRARCSFLWSFCMTVMQEVCTVFLGDYAFLSVGNVKRVGGVYKQYPLSLA